MVAGSLFVGPAAHADNGIDVTSKGHYELEAKGDVVRAAMTITVRNEQPSVRTGNYIQYYYLPGITVPIPADAERLTATSYGAPLSVTRTSTKDPSTAIATVDFPSNLLYGQSRTIDLRFVLKGEKPRSADLTRVGPGYATFAVFGPGDEGQNTVEVVLPKSMTFDSTTDLFSSEESGDSVTYTATQNTDDAGFWAIVSARDPEIAKRTKVELGGQQVDVMAYQDDPRWLRFVRSRITKGVPVLEELVDTPWPGGLSTVREDRSVNVRGYDGWFDPGSSEIVIGEELDPETLYHELSHAWANADTLGQRWLYEGLAQELAGRAVAELGGKPRKPGSVSPDARDAIPLNSWAPAGARAQADDAYGYRASYAAMKALLDGCDADTTSAVLATMIADDSAYAVSDDELTTQNSEWQQFLDIVEIVGGNHKAPAIYATWVLTKHERTLLKTRHEARAAYREVDRGDGDFAPPLGLRQSMTTWEFVSAMHAAEELQDLGPAVVSVQDAAERYDMDIPDEVVALYQGAETSADYAALPDTLPKAASAIEAVGESDRAARAGRNPFAALGARILDVDGKAAKADRLLAKADLDGASAAADDATAAARWITWLGIAAVLGALLLVAGIAWAVRALARRRARARSARDEAARAAAEAADSPTAEPRIEPPAAPDLDPAWNPEGIRDGELFPERDA